MRTISNNDLVGLMGMCEMECALAFMINLSQQRGVALSALVVQQQDFPKGDEADGFRELNENGWLLLKRTGYCAKMGLVARAQKRFPELS